MAKIWLLKEGVPRYVVIELEDPETTAYARDCFF